MLAAWLRSAGRLLRAGGTVSLIWRADALDAVLRALAAGFGAAVVLPIHAKPGKAAIRVLVRATKASRAALTLLPSFFLEDAAGQVSKEAEALLRQGAMLPLASL
jgi:tRNA1(Val) A37 N6-methylase TrmN6